ncbi:hypothetical protein DM01DRAFT_1340563 [Hesseltinella vesiculosa]|uniref:SMP-LTD domain-containing protein n=1 Tax=Hesseltinella vesiculosa TaxID=101127 RepID=A0A1X2G3P1_9FUNG|nr:hypothetical protein DM01DRAFT_1340563 [Hesseltinella vesiculosa]
MPMLLWLAHAYLSIPPPSTETSRGPQEVDVTTSYNYGTKKGWIRLSSNYLAKATQIGKKKQGKQSGEGFGVLKQGVLKVYTDEMQQHLEWVLDLHEYNVSLYPPGRLEHILFSRSVALKLERKDCIKDDDNITNSKPTTAHSSASSDLLSSSNSTPVSLASPSSSFDHSQQQLQQQRSQEKKVQDPVLYFSCSRPVDKEDWYFAFMSTCHTNTPGYHAIPFDPMAVASLITSIGQQQRQEHVLVNSTADRAVDDDPLADDDPLSPTSSVAHAAIPWFNAVLGRTFLAIYKTQRFQSYVLETLAKKTKKMKTPGFLGDIQVRDVDVGMAVPFVTQPKLVALQPDGTLVLDAQVDYRGGFKVVVEANAAGAFSIRVPLVLSLTLQSLSGVVRFKIKPPPSNRYWIGFCTMPVMKWSIVPAVSSYNVKISLVTKIIEAKIRRMMTDNMVLPNMEDIPFARSDGKGGIFNDAEPAPSDTTSQVSSPDQPMDSHLHQSFVIQPDKSLHPYNNSSSESLMSPPTLSASSSTPGRWSRLFLSRRKKAPTENTSVTDAAETEELPTDDTDKDFMMDAQREEKADGSLEEPIAEAEDLPDQTESLAPDRTSPSSSHSPLDDTRSIYSVRSTSSTSVNATAGNGTTTTRRRKLYNAAGYLLSKSKTLASDFRDYRQQDLHLKRQKSQLQYADQLEDMRRRCNENEVRRQSSPSLPLDPEASTSPSSGGIPILSSNSTSTLLSPEVTTPLSRSAPNLPPSTTTSPSHAGDALADDDSLMSYKSVADQPPLPPRRPPQLPPRN